MSGQKWVQEKARAKDPVKVPWKAQGMVERMGQRKVLKKAPGMVAMKVRETVLGKGQEKVQLKALRKAPVMDQGWVQDWAQAMVHR